jgi:hypothetical protein
MALLLQSNYSLRGAEIKLLSESTYCPEEQCGGRGFLLAMNPSPGRKTWHLDYGSVSSKCLVYLFRAQFPKPYGWREHKINTCQLRSARKALVISKS